MVKGVAGHEAVKRRDPRGAACTGSGRAREGVPAALGEREGRVPWEVDVSS